jgi:hypothetical protein
MKKGLKILIIIVAVLVVIGLGILFYFKAPDMKPLSSYLPWGSSFYKVNDNGSYDTPPTISAQLRQAINQDKTKYDAIIFKNDTREAQIVNQLKTGGITVGGAYVVDTDAGEQMLALNLPITGGILTSTNFINNIADSMVKMAALKTLDLTGLAYVNMFISDDQDRILFGVTARTVDILNYRNGKITLEQFFATTAASVESRSGALEAVSGGLK